MMKKTLFLSIALFMAAGTMAQAESGLYKQTKFLTQDGEEHECTQDVYILLKDNKTYEIQTYITDGVRRAYVVEKDMTLSKSNDNSKELTYTWTYDLNGYPGGQNTEQVTNIYSPAKGIMSNDMRIFLNLMDKADKKGVKKNKLLGVWHEADESSTMYYKLYDTKERMTLHIAKVGNIKSMIFTIEDVVYDSNGNTREGGNPCLIKWEGANRHTLAYDHKGHTFTETWTRASMPDYVMDIFD